MKSNSKLLYTFCCDQGRNGGDSRRWFINVCDHTGRMGLQNNAVHLLVIHALQTDTRQFVNWFSMKTTTLEIKCSQRKTLRIQVWRGGIGKILPSLGKKTADLAQRLWFIFIFITIHNYSTKYLFCSLPFLPHFTPTSFLSIFFLEVIGKWNKLQHSGLTPWPGVMSLSLHVDHVTSK